MVIAFFSTIHGQAGTSANMLSVGIMSALKYNKNVFLAQSHFTENFLEDFLVKKPRQVQEAEVLDDYGIDTICRTSKLYAIDKEMLLRCSYSFLEGHLHLLPGTGEVNKEVIEKSMEEAFVEIVHIAKIHFDLVFVDVNAIYGVLREKILEQADLLVANFCQNPRIMSKFFTQRVYDRDKIIYLLGNYDKKSHYNQTNLRFLFPEMNKKNTVYIEYNRTFKEALLDTEILTFFRRYSECGKKDKHYSYFKSVKKTTSYILNKAGECHA